MIRLSYSALGSLHSCERRFQLDRLLVGERTKDETAAQVLGKAYGNAVQDYLVHKDVDKALLNCYLSYSPVLVDDNRSEEAAMAAFLSSLPHLDSILDNWEVATFNGKKAIELSFRLNIDEKFYYVGYVDLVLKNLYTGRYAIGEVKTTSLQLLDLSPVYGNSGQGIGYSIILDSIVGKDNADYDVLYLVCQLKKGLESKFHPLPFFKTLKDRLNWFITLGMDVNHLHDMLNMNVFPMRGGGCLSYMRPCRHFGTCQLTGFDEYKIEEEDKTVYDFTFQLEEVIQDHLARIS